MGNAHCKEMAPAWEELAEKYRDHGDIVIAELDATAMKLEAFPLCTVSPTLKVLPSRARSEGRPGLGLGASSPRLGRWAWPRGQPWVQNSGSPDHVPPQVIDYKGARDLETFSQNFWTAGRAARRGACGGALEPPSRWVSVSPGLGPVLWRVAVKAEHGGARRRVWHPAGSL